MRAYSKVIYIKLLCCFLLVNHTVSAQFLNVGVVQMDKKPDLIANKNTILKYIGEAKNQGCDLIVFPESALGCEMCASDSVYIKKLASAMEEIRNAVQKNQIYTVFCVQNLLKEGSGFKNRMYAMDEKGEIAKIYDKLWDQKNYTLPSGTITVKGIPIGLTICADRWLRTTTDLPLMHAPVSIECSWSKLDTVYFPYGPIEGIHWWEIQKPDSTFLDCSPTKGPYWIPRAIRNDAYIICAGRRASIVDPNGNAYHCPDKTEQLLVKQINVSALIREHAHARFDHEVFKPWWELGTKLLSGEEVESIEPETLVSDPKELTIALAQIAVSDHMDENLKRIEQNIIEAKTGKADLVVFPALSVTGKSPQSDMHSAAIEAAVHEISTWAKRYGIYVIVGSAWKENEDLFNAAFVIDDEGKLMTRYDQLSADNTTFLQGKSTRAMWFNLKNVQGVVTVGNDVYWEEIAELSACKGAQLLINIANDNFGKYEEYFEQSFATFNTFTVIVNAAEDHEMSASGKSRVFNDLRRPEEKYHADLIVEADGQPGLFFVKEKMESINPWFNKIKKLNRSMIPWFNYGVDMIYKAPTVTHVMGVEN